MRRHLTRPGRLATILTTLVLLACTAALSLVHPAVALAWLGSTALMTVTHGTKP